MEQSRHQQGVCKGLLCWLPQELLTAHLSSNSGFLKIFNSGMQVHSLYGSFSVICFHCFHIHHCRCSVGALGPEQPQRRPNTKVCHHNKKTPDKLTPTPTSSIPLDGVCCMASSCLLDFTDDKNKSKRAVSAVK